MSREPGQDIHGTTPAEIWVRELAWIALGLGLAATFLIWDDAKHAIENEAHAHFERRTDEVRSTILHHMEDMATFLRAGASLFYASTSVKEREWHAFFSKLKQDDDLPGILSVSFLPRLVAAGNKNSPAPLAYVHSFTESTLLPHPYELFPETVRQAAQDIARDSGKTGITASAPMAMPGSGRLQHATLLYLPVYRNGAATDTVNARRAALEGYVFSLNETKAMIDAALEHLREGLDIHIYDGPQVRDDALIYDSDDFGASSLTESPYIRAVQLDISGRVWTLIIGQQPGHLPQTAAHKPAYLLASGVTISLFLFIILWTLANKRASALAQVEAMRIRAHESENRWQFALDGSGDGVWDWNIQTGKVYLSPHWKGILGYQDEDPGSEFGQWVTLVHPDDRAAHRDKLDLHLRGEAATYEHEHRVRCKDGSYKWILDRGKTFDRDPEGKPRRVIGTYTDISEHKRLEAALHQAKDAAEKANAAKSEFLSRMSHELRTPLNAIMGFAQLLVSDKDAPLNESQIENLDEILNAGRHLLDLINEVLDLARIESGRLELSTEAVAIVGLTEECLALVRPLAEARGVALLANIKCGCGMTCVIQTDRLRLRQILLNLLSNAVKYNRVGGKVETRCSLDGQGNVRIEVQDTGAGIPAEFLPHLFQPFERLDSSNTGSEGTGIGLALSRHLVDAMGGKLGVDSMPGLGSTFWILLPLSACAGAVANCPGAPAAPSNEENSRPSVGESLNAKQPQNGGAR